MSAEAGAIPSQTMHWHHLHRRYDATRAIAKTRQWRKGGGIKEGTAKDEDDRPNAARTAATPPWLQETCASVDPRRVRGWLFLARGQEGSLDRPTMQEMWDANLREAGSNQRPMGRVPCVLTDCAEGHVRRVRFVLVPALPIVIIVCGGCHLQGSLGETTPVLTHPRIDFRTCR